MDQATIALDFADENFAVSVLELPYIFGAQKGRKPVRTFLVDMIRQMPIVTLYPKGGTAMIIARQVGECITSTLEIGEGGQLLPVCTHNMPWKEMLTIFHEYMGTPNRKVITIPTFLFRANAKKIVKEQRASGFEGELDMVAFVKVMTSNAFMRDDTGKRLSGVTPDDIKQVISESVQLRHEVLEKKADLIDMKDG